MTLLNIRRSLLLYFPEFSDVRYTKSQTGISFHCMNQSDPVDMDRLLAWEKIFKPAGMKFDFIQTTTFSDKLEDIEEKLLEIPASISMIEDTAPTEQEATVVLRRVFGDVIVNVSSSVSYSHEEYSASFTVWVNEEPAEDAKHHIEFLINCIFLGEFSVLYVIHPHPHQNQHNNSTTGSLRQEEDLSLLHDNIESVLSGSDLPTLPHLPEKSATVISLADGIGSIKRLSTIFDNVYTEVPVKLEYFPKAFGVDIEEYIESLPLNRIIPVFTQKLENYEKPIVEKILNADVRRIVLPGELQLRMIDMMCRIHPMVSLMHSMDADYREIQSLINSASEIRLEWAMTRKYAETIAKWLTKLRLAAKSLTPLGITNTPISQGIGEILGMLMPNMPDRFIEFGAAFHFGILNKCLSGTCVSVEGHFLEKYYDVMNCVGFTSGMVQKINPMVIGSILIGENDMDLSAFLADFDGPAIARMRMLMNSPRLIGNSDANIQETLKDFNKEARKFNKPGSPETAVEIAGIAKDVFIDGPTGIAISPISKILLAGAEKSKPLLADKISAKLKRTTQEGVALAKIRRAMGY